MDAYQRIIYILKEIRSLSFIYTSIKTRDNLIELRGCHGNYKDKYRMAQKGVRPFCVAWLENESNHLISKTFIARSNV